MNLTYKSALNSLEARAGQFETFAGTIEDAIERGEALESLQVVRNNLRTINNVLDELVSAKSSLESSGFSEEWFAILNAHGNFLDTIHVDLVDLLGTDEDKAAVCMEGLGETIWNWIKRAFQWIVDMFNKIVGFFRRVLGVWNSDVSTARKMEIYLNNLAGVDILGLTEAIEKNGTIANHSGVYDVRTFLNRMQLDRMIVDRMLYMHDFIFGGDPTAAANSYQRFFNDAFMSYVCDTPQDRQVNPALAHITEDIGTYSQRFDTVLAPFLSKGQWTFKKVNTPPLKLFMDNQLSCMTFDHASMSNIKAQLDRCGIRFSNSGYTITMSITDADQLSRIKYSQVYKNLQDIQSVMKCSIEILDETGKSSKTQLDHIDRIKKDVAEAARGADQFKTTLKTIDPSSRNPVDVQRRDNYGTMVRCYTSYVKWVNESVSIMSRLVSDIARCKQIVCLTNTAIGKAIKDHVSQD